MILWLDSCSSDMRYHVEQRNRFWSHSIGRKDGASNGSNSMTSTENDTVFSKLIPQTNPVIFGFSYYTWNGLTQDNGVAHVMYGGGPNRNLLRIKIDRAQRLTCDISGSNDIVQSTEILKPYAWHYIEVKFYCHSSSGYIIIKVNGEEWINYSGDTQGTATSTDAMFVGFSTDPASNCYGRWDDFYICDTNGTLHNDFLGDMFVARLTPSDSGIYQDFAGSDGNDVDNYALLVQAQPTGWVNTNYVISSGEGDVELYQYASIDDADSIIGIRSTTSPFRTGTHHVSGVNTLYTNDTLHSGEMFLCPIWDKYNNLSSRHFIYDSNPVTGSGWTVDEINNIQHGFTVRYK